MKNLIEPLICIIFISLILNYNNNLIAQNDQGWKTSIETVEHLTKATPNVNYYEEKVPVYTLPDILTTTNGKTVTNFREWNKKRRPEILELFRENVYGRVPGTTYQKSYKVVNENKLAMNGNATLKEVDITISSMGESLVIHIILFIPNNSLKPVPAFLLINNRGSSNIDPSRKVKSEFWPAEDVIARGYAIAAFNNSDVDPDNFDNFRNGIHGLLDKDPRPDDAWGTIAAWAWGASRCLDYLETEKNIAVHIESCKSEHHTYIAPINWESFWKEMVIPNCSLEFLNF